MKMAAAKKTMGGRISILEITVRELRKEFRGLAAAVSDSPTKRDILTPEQAAEYLQMPVSKVMELCERKEIPCAQICGEYRLPKWLLDKWVVNLEILYRSEQGKEEED